MLCRWEYGDSESHWGAESLIRGGYSHGDVYNFYL